MVKISEIATDANIGGLEQILLNDAGTSKKCTVDALSAAVVDYIEDLSGLADPAAGDSFVMLENGTAMKISTYASIEDAIANTMYAELDIGALAAADVFLTKDNATTKGITTAAAIAAYCLSVNEPLILDISDKDAKTTPVDADLFLNCDGTTPKKTTFAQLKATILGGFDTYMNALSAAGSANLTDVMYCTQSGTEAKLTIQQIQTLIGASIDGSGAAGYFASWSDADTLTNTYTPVSTFDMTGSAVAIPTSAAVRGEMNTIINDSTAMAAAIASADTILIDDGAGGTQRKATFTQVLTWIATNYVEQAHIADPAATAVDPDALTASALGDLVATNGGWGYSSEANADAVHTKFDLLIADVTSIRTQLVALIDDVQANNAAIDLINAAQAGFGVTASS